MHRIYTFVLVIIFLGIVFHAPLSVGLGVVFPDYSLLIKSWKEILMLLLVPLAITIVTRQKMWKELLGDWIVRVIIAYVTVHFLIVIFLWQGTAPTLAGLAIDLRYILFFALAYVAIRAWPEARRSLVIAATVGACVVVGFATLQLFLPPDILSHIGYSKATIEPYLTVDKNPNYIRVNSTLRGPNPLGAYAGMVLGFLAAALMRGRLALKGPKMYVGIIFLAICSVIALWISYSRSALVAGTITVFVAVLLTQLRKMTRRMWVASAVILFALAGGIVVFQGTTFVSNVILHENPKGGSELSSNEGHLASLQDGVRWLLVEPFGVGVGSTGSASLLGDSPIIAENQYLFIAHEIGWCGLMLFVVLFALIMMRLWRFKQDWLSLGAFASGIGLALIGLLLPVWTDDTVSIIWWGLAAIALAGGDNARNKTK
jgi:hypothetical protein